jgi:hypothetical protein
MSFDPARGWWAGAAPMSTASRTALPAIRLAASVARAIIGVVRATEDAELRALALYGDARAAPQLLAGLPNLPHGRREIAFETPWDPPLLPANAHAVRTVTVAGAAVGDAVSVGFTQSSSNVLMFGTVTAADTVAVIAWNWAPTATDLAGGTLRLRVSKT